MQHTLPPAQHRAACMQCRCHAAGMHAQYAGSKPHHSGSLAEQLQLSFPHTCVAVGGVAPPQQGEQHQGVQRQAVEEDTQPCLPASKLRMMFSEQEASV